MKTLCAESDNLLLPAWWNDVENDDTSLRCHQVCLAGAVTHHSVMNDVRVGEEDVGADVGEDDYGTHSFHLSVLRCTLHNPLDLSRVLICPERVGDKLDQLKRRDVQEVGMANQLE